MTVYGFTSEDKIERLYAKLGLDNILSDVAGTDRTEVIEQFMEDAEQTLMIRLGQFHLAADMVGNDWIESRTTWIAAYYISKRAGNEHYFQDMYDDALRELDAIATGELPPHPDIFLRSSSVPSMSNLVIDDRFQAAKLRVNPHISVGEGGADQHSTYGLFWGWI